MDGPVEGFPAGNLPAVRRFITTHNQEGLSVFHSEDDGSHQRVTFKAQGAINIIYSTGETPVDMNNEKDLAYASDNEVR